MQNNIAPLVLALLCSATSAHAQGVTRVESFTPTGSIGSVEQVHARFSDFLFALGDEARQPAPFTHSCEALGKGRWLNPREWVFEFTGKAPARLTCEFKAREGLKSGKGIPVVGAPEFKFVVSPADIERMIPRFADTEKEVLEGHGERIDPDQAFVIQFDKKIGPEEIVRRYSFRVEGRAEPVAVKLLEPAVLKRIVAEGRQWIRPQANETWVVLQPALEFPNRENMVVTFEDSENGTKRYFKTRPFFRAEFTCSCDNVRAPCSPVAQVELSFNSPVAVDQIRKMRVTSKASGARSVEGQPSESDSHQISHDERAIFKGPFKAGATYRVELPKGLVDIRGRKLSNAASFPLEFGTDGLPALAKFPGSFGVIEAAQPVLPLSLRNVEKQLRIQSAQVARFQPEENARAILNWLDRVWAQKNRYGDDKRENQKAHDYHSVFKAYGREVGGKLVRAQVPIAGESNQAEVIGIPLEDGGKARKGLHIVELESQVLGTHILDRKEPFYTSTAALVTDLGVHFKWGQAGPSLVWVTELGSGRPVEGADVHVEDCHGKALARGKTSADGTFEIASLPSEGKLSSSACHFSNYESPSLVVMAKKGDDFSFTLDTWKEGLESWRFNVGGGYYGGSSGGDSGDEWTAHTVLARDYLKPGQAVNMKHYVRQFHWKGFLLPKSMPKYVVITHLGSEETWNFPVKFGPTGIATSNWTLPETASLGTYSISLATELPKKGSAFRPRLTQTGTFEVQEFRLPTLGVSMRIPDPITAEVAGNLDAARIALQGTYLSGGPASDLPMELRFQRKAAPKQSRTVGDFTYSQDEPVKTGIIDKKEEEYSYEYEGEDGEGGGTPHPKEENVLASKLLAKVNLDKGGAASVPMPKEVLDTDQDGDVYVSLSYSDPSGEIHSMVRSTSVYSRDRYLGVHKDFSSYVSSPKGVKLDLSLADPKGGVVPGEKISVDLYQRNDYTHRERLVGGFYGYRTTTETKKVGEICSGKTSAAGTLTCRFDLPGTGRYVLQANARDSRGKELVYARELSAYGYDGETEGFSESDRMTLVPNQEEYEAGDTAEIAVQSSFQNAYALVTMEREGVLSHKIESISGARPVIRLPIAPEHSPNVVVSVLAVRGRIGEPPPTGLLDLAKPAFKLGMARLRIGKKGHELPVKVTTDKPSYQVREKVSVTIGTKPGAELALAVVDKALLRLKPNTTWDLLNAMITSRPHQVETSTLQMNVIGKRHFGKKATPFGGGGGNLMTRELLDSLVAWKPSLKADAQGQLRTDFRLNDAISGFVVVAVGSEGLNLFGSGKAEITSTQDLQIISSIPPTLRERDRLPLQWILRNATARPLHVKATLVTDQESRRPQDVEIGPQSAVEVRWEDIVPMGARTRAFTLTAVASEGPSDKLKVTSKVVEVLPARVIEGYLQQLGAQTASLPVKFPAEAAPDKGGYRVQAQARLSEVPDSVLRYMRDYPFSCFEQQTSKAMTLQDVKMWQAQLKNLKSYLDSNSLIKYFPDMQYGSLDLTSYVLAIAAEAGKSRPEMALTHKSFNPANLQRLLEAVRKGMRGEIRVAQTWWPSYVQNNERIMAGEALSLYEPIQPADYEALKSVRDRQSLTHALSLLAMLRNSPKTLEKSLGDADAYLSEILSAYQFENAHLRLRNPRFWFYGPLSATPDGIKARTLVQLVERDQKDPATKLLRAMVEEMRTGYFDTTPGNAWGVVALGRFRQRYERSPVAGSVALTMGPVTKSVPLSDKKPKAEAFVPVASVREAKTLSQSWGGSGAPWTFTLVEAALPLTKPVDHGFVVTKSVEPVTEARNGGRTRGDIYRVKLVIESRAPQSWVVVVDPVPTGASILSTSSSGGGAIAFEERRMDRMQVFYEYFPQGKVEFSYDVRLNQAGAFEFPPTRVEAMYDPTQYGESPNDKTLIGE